MDQKREADHDAEFDVQNYEDFTAEEIPNLVAEAVTAKQEAHDENFKAYLSDYEDALTAELEQKLKQKLIDQDEIDQDDK